MTPDLGGRISSIQIGRIARLGPERTRSAFVKTPVAGPIEMGALGLAGDQHGNPLLHGGPDKAVYFYPGEHYPVWRALFPELAAQFVPGSLGDNVTMSGIGEFDVCIEDVFNVGGAVVQALSPRTPCFKITARFGNPVLGATMHKRNLRGFYARVLQPGKIEAGDEIVLARRSRDERVAEMKSKPPLTQGFAEAV